ncbi:putative heterokaryon incompatibility protein [Erysiphe necator]|uniref:Putative heterokaryon incompatibility protein n=1 Tax=Uncinula necator TaxID=52586 RepID=A0A0B1P4U1_UNCNE|nr:putative heterokaryon incompatibility protein [Erysiphe necator]
MWRKFSNSSPSFIYPPISAHQIRILTLHPGLCNSPIVIEIQKHDLKTVKETYEALSYVWGEPTRRAEIECNGAVLRITKSLHAALRQLRYQDKSRILWVDAICINQNDLDERAQQVSLMKSIFPMASKVLVWLGEADEKTELAIKAIDKWATFNRQYRCNSDATRFSKFEERFAFKPGYRDTLEAVGALTYRPWFDRCWTFQEIILSTQAELNVGKFRITWDCFYHALEAFPMHLLADNVLNFNALFMCHGKEKTKRHSSKNSDSITVSRNLSRVLQITRNFTATDPRDKIFSVLSIAEIKNPIIFQPNYNKSVRDTFISSTLAMIREENSLNVLMSCGEHNRDRNLPSWCPDWNCKRGVTLAGYFDYISYNINAGIHPDLRNLQVNQNYELELDGAIIDVVKEVYDLEALGKQLKASLKDLNFTSVLSEFARKIGLHKRLLHNKLSPEAVLFRTLTADHWFFGTHLKSSYKEIWFPTHLRFQYIRRNKEKMYHSIEAFSPKSYRSNIADGPSLDLNSMGFVLPQPDQITNKYGQPPENFDAEFESPFTHSVIDKVYRQTSPFYVEGQDFDDAKNIDVLTIETIAKEAISQAIFFFKGKRVLITEHDFVAIGSNEAKVGDKLCSFWGVDVPFIIRQKGKSFMNYTDRNQISRKINDLNELYEIIGECYIDGIMYGELYPDSNQRSPWTPNRSFQKISPLIDWVQIRKLRIV